MILFGEELMDEIDDADFDKFTSLKIQKTNFDVYFG